MEVAKARAKRLLSGAFRICRATTGARRLVAPLAESSCAPHVAAASCLVLAARLDFIRELSPWLAADPVAHGLHESFASVLPLLDHPVFHTRDAAEACFLRMCRRCTSEIAASEPLVSAALDALGRVMEQMGNGGDGPSDRSEFVTVLGRRVSEGGGHFVRFVCYKRSMLPMVHGMLTRVRSATQGYRRVAHHRRAVHLDVYRVARAGDRRARGGSAFFRRGSARRPAARRGPQGLHGRFRGPQGPAETVAPRADLARLAAMEPRSRGHALCRGGEPRSAGALSPRTGDSASSRCVKLRDITCITWLERA